MKTYLSDLDVEKRIEIIMNNESLSDIVYRQYYETQMENQLEDGQLMFGKDSWKYIDIKDNYNSFFLVLKNWHNFIDNLDSDYLCPEGIELYNKIMLLKNDYENIDVVEEEERFNELEEEIEDKCKTLLSICENQLHQYEEYPSENDIKEYLEFELEENNLFSDYYILDNNCSKVYNDITNSYE